MGERLWWRHEWTLDGAQSAWPWLQLQQEARLILAGVLADEGLFPTGVADLHRGTGTLVAVVPVRKLGGSDG